MPPRAGALGPRYPAAPASVEEALAVDRDARRVARERLQQLEPATT